jgi:hypothetical protein
VVKSNGAFNVDLLTRHVEIEERHAIAEGVVNPAKTGWLGRNGQMRVQQVLVKTVSGAK